MVMTVPSIELPVDPACRAAALGSICGVAHLSVDDIVRGIEARVAKNDREANSTWDAATRVEIARELKVNPEDVSSEGGEPDGPLGAAVDAARVEGHPRYAKYWRVAGAV